ncbi:MAG: TIGR01212 family radical SAM protein [Lachnospiraceae bacterium]
MRPYYYSFNEYLQDTFGTKVYKLSLNGGLTCPNRDGLIDTRGCIFCSAGGSGDFVPPFAPVEQQINIARKRIAPKYKGNSFIGYFQNFTNTYGPVDYLEKIFTDAISNPCIIGISIGTRPDCLGDEVIDLLSRLNRRKKVWVELGLQTIHESSARFIRRGYNLEVYDDAVKRLHANNIDVVTHLIIGLPHETPEMIIESAKYVAGNKVSGIKLQLLHVLKGTDLARLYAQNEFSVLSMEEYFDIIGPILPILPPDMVIHRITGDGPKKLLIAPMWSANKHNVLNSLTRYIMDNNIVQGSLFLQ